MKLIKLLLVIMSATLITLALSGTGLAFHGDGVAHCDGCHSMHNSANGLPMPDVTGNGDYLLKAGEPTTVCLNCHQNYGQFSGGEGFGAGGDFYWITKTFSWSAHGSIHESRGDNHGHNVISDAFGLPEETDNTTGMAPGGDYLAANLSCASCHDPHGGGDFERLLRGAANPPDDPGTHWANDPAELKVTSFRTTGGSGVSDTSHTVYGKGMSAWCSNCHYDFLIGTAWPMHPADENLGTEHYQNYNGYRSTSNPTGNGQDGAYLEMVPFAVTDFAGTDTSSVLGPGGSNDQVLCLSCHRAHATAFPNSGRWDFETEEPVSGSHPATGDTGVTGNDVFNSYYGRDMIGQFGADQRSFCNKCHVKDGA